MGDGLSREQVERLAKGMHTPDDCGRFCSDDEHQPQALAVAPTVAAMLAKARAEGERRAWDEAADALSAEAVQVLRRFAQIAGVDGPTPAQRDGMRAALLWRADPAHPLARHHTPSAAAGAPPEPSQVSSGAEDHPESARPSDGRTEAQGPSGGRRSLCGERLGFMRCQLKRGHDGQHEDWSGA